MHTLSILFVLALLVGAVFLLWQSLRPSRLSGRPGAGGGKGSGRDGRPPTKEV